MLCVCVGEKNNKFLCTLLDTLCSNMFSGIGKEEEEREVATKITFIFIETHMERLQWRGADLLEHAAVFLEKSQMKRGGIYWEATLP